MNGLSLRISGGGVSSKGAKCREKELKVVKFPDLFSSQYDSLPNFKNIVEPTCVNSQLEYIRTISKELDVISKDRFETVNVMVSFIVNVFLIAPVKHPLKNTAARILSSNKKYVTKIQLGLSDEITRNISDLSDSCDFLKLNDIITVLNSCFENFSPGVEAVTKSTKNILPFLENTLKTYCRFIRNQSSKLSPTEKLEIFTYIHNLNRLLITMLQKCDINFYSISSIEVWFEFSKHSTYLIKLDDLPMDTKLLCSMIFITISQIRFGDDVWKYILEILFKCEDHSDHLVYEDVVNFAHPIEILCICSSFINIVNLTETETVLIEGMAVLTFLSKKMYELSEKMSVETTIIIGVARFMFSVSRLLFKMTDKVETVLDITKIILSFIWSHLEYYVDNVRHLSTQILLNIVKISVQLEQKGNTSFSTELFTSVMLLPPDRHSKYKGLATLSSEYGTNHIIQRYPNIVDDLLSAVNSITIPANVSVAFETLMFMHSQEVSIDVLFDTWIAPVLNTMMTLRINDEATISSMNVLQEIISKGIELNPSLISIMIPFIVNIRRDSELSNEQLKCILICLHEARKSGCFDSDQNDESQRKWKNIIDYEVLHRAAHQKYSEIRILMFHLIVDTRKTTELYTQEEFGLLKEFFHYNINTQSPAMRQNILSTTKKMIKRWKDSYEVLLRNLESIANKLLLKKDNDQFTTENAQSNASALYKNIKKIYISFAEDLWDFCMRNMFPGANYSRRNISLQILVWCQEFGLADHVKLSWRQDAVKSLLSALDDSYECNKELAVQLLSYCPAEYLQFNDPKRVKSFLNETLDKASSVKPTDCTTAAYALSLFLRFPNEYQVVLKSNLGSNPNSIAFEMHHRTIKFLMKELVGEMETAESNILMASSSKPMYGLLHCIRHIMNQVNYEDVSGNPDWSSLIYDLVQMSFKINKIVASVVNNSSPEGHLPMDFNAGTSHVEGNGVMLDGGRRVTAQMVLLCAWRSVKEVSLLLGDISYNIQCDIEGSGTNFISSNLILEIGDHFTTLLSETKHRGAFEQAYLGFSKLCLRLWKSTIECLHSLPKQWLNELIAMISGDSKKSKLCATRRSAGVPFMVQALVTTELQVTGKPQSFQNCMKTLLSLATFSAGDQTSVETRTHCLNILRALYRHTALGEHVNPYVARGLMTAITGFGGATWAERNSSTLLFSSLVTRVFGVQRSKDSDKLCIRNRMTGRIFFLRYPQLYDFILDHLKEVSESIDSQEFLKPSLYPILLLLSRLYPSSLEGTDSNLKLVAYIPYLLTCAKCSVMKTRQLAAKAMVPLISHDRYFQHVFSLMDILSDVNIKTNYCHGILLQLVRLLQNVPENCTITNDILQQLKQSLNKSKWILSNINGEKSCFVTSESYLQVVYLCVLRFGLDVPDSTNSIDAICKTVMLKNDDKLKIHFGKEKFFETSLHLMIQMAYEKRDYDEIAQILKGFRHIPCYELQSIILSYVLYMNSRKEKDILFEQFEICDIVKTLVNQLPLNAIVDLKEKINSENHIAFENYWSVNSDCYRNQLMILTYDQDLSEKYWKNSPVLDSSEENCLLYFLRQTHSNSNQQINRFIHLRHINNHFKNTNIVNIYEMYSESVVLFLCRNMFISWSCENVTNMNLECVQFIKNHWSIFNWKSNLHNKRRVYTILLQWASILNLLDDEEEIVRHEASQLVSVMLRGKDGTVCEDFCESKAKELFLKLVTDYCKEVSESFAIFMLSMLAFVNDDLVTVICDDGDNDGQVFDKEVASFQENVFNVGLCATQITEILNDKQSSISNIRKPINILEIIESECKDVWISHENMCKEHHTTFCLFWQVLRSQNQTLIRSNHSKNVLDKIDHFLKELNINFECSEVDNTPEICTDDHIYKHMTGIDINI